MKTLKPILAVFLATLWISLSEFFRNQFLVQSFWTEHYNSLGLIFPSEPINGAMWGVWSLLYALAVYFLSRRFNLWQSILLAWFVAFPMMWVVLGNLGVLPYGLLWYTVPLSLLEAFVAAWIIVRICRVQGA